MVGPRIQPPDAKVAGDGLTVIERQAMVDSELEDGGSDNDTGYLGGRLFVWRNSIRGKSDEI